MKTITVQVHKVLRASKEEAKAFKAAARQLEIELNDEDFWDEVHDEYLSWTCKKVLAGPRLQTFDEFKEMIFSGKDMFNTEMDHDIDISVTFYYSWSRTVGYTYPSTWATWINRNVFKGFDLGDIAGNQIHEYIHNCGLDHPGVDRKSVTYQFGYLLRDRVKKRLELAYNLHIIYKRSLWGRVKQTFRRLFSWVY